MRLKHAFCVAAVALGLAFSSAQAGPGGAVRTHYYSNANTHLIIKRAVNFGNHANLTLYIDGRQTAVVRYGRSFETTLPAGLHLITMRQAPHFNDAYPYSQQWVRLAPDRTSVYTAIWRDGGTRIRLERS
jgi:hypothetical protein